MGARSEAAAGKIRIMTVGRHPPAPGAEIVVGALLVEGRRHRRIPSQVLVELTLVRAGDHVRLVLSSGDKAGGAAEGISDRYDGVVVLPGIARRAERVRPAEVDSVDVGDLLAHEQPSAVPLTLVLECKV